MKYCPLISFGKQYTNEVDCMGENCMLFDGYHGCIITAAFMTYINNNAYKESGYHYDDDFDFFDRCD